MEGGVRTENETRRPITNETANRPLSQAAFKSIGQTALYSPCPHAFASSPICCSVLCTHTVSHWKVFRKKLLIARSTAWLYAVNSSSLPNAFKLRRFVFTSFFRVLKILGVTLFLFVALERKCNFEKNEIRRPACSPVAFLEKVHKKKIRILQKNSCGPI